VVVGKVESRQHMQDDVASLQAKKWRVSAGKQSISHATHYTPPHLHTHNRHKTTLLPRRPAPFPAHAQRSPKHSTQASSSVLRSRFFLPRRHSNAPCTHNPTGKASHGPQRHHVARRGAPSLLAAPHGEYTLPIPSLFPCVAPKEILPLTNAPPTLPISTRAARS